MKKPGCIIAAGILIFLLIIASWAIDSYNKLVRLDQDVKEQWSQVETQYQRRIDLIPNMVELVKRYAKHEKQIFKDIAEARAKYAGATNQTERIRAASQLEGVLSRLLVIVENYPNLKANETFVRLMDQWEGTENRISVQRMRYNEIVKRYNYAAKSFMGRFWVSLFGFDKEKLYFEATKGAEVAPDAKKIWSEE
jgi:LemA protein